MREVLEKLARRISGIRNEATYKEIIEVSLQVAQMASTVANTEAHPEDLRFAKGLQSYLDRIWQEELGTIKATISNNIVLVPTSSELTIQDFNSFVGKGIAPIGLIPKAQFADRTLMTPYQFLIHDIGHASDMAGYFTNSQRIFWDKVLGTVAKENPRDQAIMHNLLFYLTHERSPYAKDVLNLDQAKWLLSDEEKRTRILKSGTRSVYEFLEADHFFDLPELQKRLPTNLEFEEVQAKLLKLMERAKHDTLTKN